MPFPAKTDWTSPNALWRTAIFFCIAIYPGIEAIRESRVAPRQQITSGVVTDCHAIRGGTFCHYTFTLDDTPHTGGSDAVAPHPGHPVTVFYDPQNPAANSLENFYNQANSHRTLACFMLSVSALTAVLVLFGQWNNPTPSD